MVEAIQLFAKNLDSVLATAVTVGNAATIAAHIATQVVFQLVSNVVNAFDTLTFGAIDALHGRAQALKQTVAAIRADLAQDFLDIENAWKGVGQAAQKTNQQLAAGSRKSAEGLAALGTEAEKTRIQFEPLNPQAVALGKALKDLGVDASQATVGIRTEFTGLVDSFRLVSQEFKAGSPVIAQAAESLAKSAKRAEEAALAQKELTAAEKSSKLSAEGHARATQLLAESLKEQAKEAAGASESSKKLSSALQSLGIDAAQVTTGIRTEFSSLAASFGEVVKGFNAGNPVIALAAQKLALSANSTQEAALAQGTLNAQLDAGKLSTEGYAKATGILARHFSEQALAAIQSAQTTEALSSALDAANQYFKAGIISADQYRQVQVALQAQINALAGAADTAARSTENLGRSMEGTAGSAQQTAQSLKQAEHSARGFAAALASIYIAQREEFRAVSEEAAATFNRIAEWEGRLRLGTSDFFGPLIEATKFTQWQIDRATSRLDYLVERLQSGRGVTEQFIKGARDSVDEFSILGDQKLDALHAEIDSASQRLQQL